jgi:hypothetical protein
MTYVNAGTTRIPKRGSKELGAVFIDIGAVGDESALIQEEYKRSVDHYLFPFSTQWSNPVTKFLRLKKEWEDNTAHLSSVTEISMNPAYQQIIGMGPVAISLILEDMRSKPGHWFWALKAITGEDPILPEQRGRIKQMTEAWLQWGRKHGYIA